MVPRFALALATLLVAAGPASTHAQPAYTSPEALGRYVDEIVGSATLSDAHWGIEVTHAVTGEVLYARNAGKNFVPASNAKIYTAAAGLALLGPGYRYETRLYADAPVEDGVIDGNLVVRGTGDPTIGGRDQEDSPTQVFEAWADSLRQLGITYVTGDIIGDDDVIDDTPFGEGWAWDDAPYYYAAELGGLVFSRNTVNVQIRAQEPGQPGVVAWAPYNTDYVTIVNSTRSIGAGFPLDEEYGRAPGTNVIHLASRVPAGRIDREALSVSNPTGYFTHVLREALVRGGLAVGGHGVDVDVLSIKPDYDEDSLRVLTHYASDSLGRIAYHLLKASDNLYAEQVLRTIGAERPVPSEDAEPGSAEMGRRAANAFFAVAGVDTVRTRLVDGSGLSRMNLITPSGTTALLRHMWNHPDEGVRRTFYQALPVGGQDGTLEYRFRSGPARQNVRAKTGTLTGVSALSGYVTTAGGTPLAFSILANNYTVRTSQVRAAQDRIVQALSAYRQ